MSYSSHLHPRMPRTGGISSLKYSKVWQLLTTWWTKDRHCHHVGNAAKQDGHSQTVEPWKYVVIRLQKNSVRHSSHSLTEDSWWKIVYKFKCSKGWQPLTSLRARDKWCQLAEPSKVEKPLTNWRAKDKFVSKLICSKAQQPLTDWRAMDKHYQQVSITTRYSSYSQTENHKQTSLASLKGSKT